MTRGEMPWRDDHQARAAVRDVLAADGARWLRERRWFADKDRTISAVVLEDLGLIPRAEGTLALAIVLVEFTQGPPTRYFLPLAVVPEGARGSPDTLGYPRGGFEVVDAAQQPWFGAWLLDALQAGMATDTGPWRFVAADDASALLALASQFPGEVMRAEQSNTSIRFGDALIAKIVRRLQPGPNPEEETLRVLAAARFAAVPAFAGSGAWRAPDGTAFPLLLAQRFVPNRGDGWNWTLERLATAPPEGQTRISNEPEAVLGERTAELHLALSRSQAADFAPVRATAETIDREIDRVRGSAREVAELLRARQRELPERVQSGLGEILTRLETTVDLAGGYRAEAGLDRIRVHGDYHLGQTLRTADDDWVIIDFEGEPARPVSERSERTSVLKDVAGMLRSFDYARAVHERNAASPSAARAAETWERGARAAFLTAYRRRLREAEGRLVPAADDDFSRALDAWELDKALYEVVYEARNRPEWLDVPLRGLLPALPDQPADATGAASAEP